VAPDPLTLLLVALFGALGAVARHLVVLIVDRRSAGRLPWGTLAVNLSGAAAIGALAALVPGPGPGGGLVWLALGVGLLGAYTTVSAFALQTLLLAREGAPGRAAINTLVTVVGGPAAAALGWMAARGLAGG